MDANTKLLKELLDWTKVGFYSAVKEMLTDVLNTENKRLAYHLADGTKGRDAIKTEAAMGSDSVKDLFQQCVNLGLMEVVDDTKRRRNFDLSSFGLMPEIEAIKSKKAAGGKS